MKRIVQFLLLGAFLAVVAGLVVIGIAAWIVCGGHHNPLC